MLGLNINDPGDRKILANELKHIYIEDMEAEAIPLQKQMVYKRALEARHNIRIAGIGDDYMQITPVEDQNDANRWLEATPAANQANRYLKRVVRKEKVVYIFAAQPTKGSSGNGNTQLDEEDMRDGRSYFVIRF